MGLKVLRCWADILGTRYLEPDVAVLFQTG